MKRIFKYGLVVEDRQLIEMPKGAQVLTVQVQRGCPCIWAIVDTDKPIEWREFLVAGTGHPIPDKHGQYVGTFQLYEEALVFHVFEGAA